jgi:hypothetical protein
MPYWKRGESNNLELDPSRTITVAVAAVLDELDLLAMGVRKLSPSSLYALTAFTEAFVLTDQFLFPWEDVMHVNLTSAAFSERPPVSALLFDSGLVAIFDLPPRPPTEVLVLKPLYDLQCSSEELKSGAWIPAYRDAVRPMLSEQLFKLPDNLARANNYVLGIYDFSTESPHRLVVLRERRLSDVFVYILSECFTARLHPLVPPQALDIAATFFADAPPGLELYRRVADIHHVKVDELLCHRGVRHLYLPPLVSILLARCKSPADLPIQLRELRAEFAPLREAISSHQQRLIAATSLREQIEAIDEFNEFWETYSRKLRSPSQRLLYRTWDIVKTANPIRWFTDTIDVLGQFDRERQVVNRFATLPNVLEMAIATPNIHQQISALERLFGSQMAVQEWSEYANYIADLASRGIKDPS